MATNTTVRRQVLPYVVAIAVIAIGATAFSGLFGLSQIQTLAAVGVLGVGIYVVGTSEDELSLPFWITAIPLALAVFGFLPDPIASAFDPVFAAIGIDPTAADGVQLVVLGFAAAIVYWAVQFRAGGGSSQADSIASKILGSGRDGSKGALTKLVDDYVTMARLTFAFGFAAAAIVAGQAGTLAAEATQFAADAPLVVSNVVTALFGWAALGGDLPGSLAWIPGLEALIAGLAGWDPGAYLFVAIFLVGAAYGVREGLN